MAMRRVRGVISAWIVGRISTARRSRIVAIRSVAPEATTHRKARGAPNQWSRPRRPARCRVRAAQCCIPQSSNW